MKKDIDIPLLKKRIETEPDFIVSPRFNNSLKLTMERYTEGCPTHVIAKALILSQSELLTVHKSALKTLAKELAN